MSKGLKFLVAATAIILLAGVTLIFTSNGVRQSVKELFGGKPEVVQTDTLTTQVAPTIDQVLQDRAAEKEYRYFDSVYMDIPDVSLIAILMKLGPSAKPIDIGKEYMLRLNQYKQVQLGASIYKDRLIPESEASKKDSVKK